MTVNTSKFGMWKQWKRDALRMHYQGKTHQEIADTLGKPYFTITSHLHRHRESYPQEYVSQYYGDLENPERKSELFVNSLVRKVVTDAVDAMPEGTRPLSGDMLKFKRSTVPPKAMCAPYGATKKPTIFVIGDLQVKQGVSLDYIHHIGAYIARKQPDIIIQIGDWFDNAALSSYDRGQLSAEGKRLSADIKAGNDAIRILDEYITSVAGYNPRKVITLGNHEDRIQRFVNENPALEGFLGNHLYDFEQYGWEVYDFLTPCIIEGIAFVHYVVAVNTGKPLGNALAGRLEKVGTSFVMGHQQTFAYHERSLQLTGDMQMALVVGACYDHDEPYKGVQGNHHFRGCVMLYEVQDGYAMHKKITLRHMRDVYEGTV